MSIGQNSGCNIREPGYMFEDVVTKDLERRKAVWWVYHTHGGSRDHKHKALTGQGYARSKGSISYTPHCLSPRYSQRDKCALWRLPL